MSRQSRNRWLQSNLDSDHTYVVVAQYPRTGPARQMYAVPVSSKTGNVPTPDQILKGEQFVDGLYARRIAKAQRALSALDVWSALLPARVANEVLGDYVEDINRRIAKGQGTLVWLRVFAAIFWTGLNAIGYAHSIFGKRSGA